MEKDFLIRHDDARAGACRVCASTAQAKRGRDREAKMLDDCMQSSILEQTFPRNEPLCCCCCCCCCPSTWYLSVCFGSNGISFCPNEILCHGACGASSFSCRHDKDGDPVPSHPYPYPSVLSAVGFLVTNGIRRHSRSSRGNSCQCICSVWDRQRQ